MSIQTTASTTIAKASKTSSAKSAASVQAATIATVASNNPTSFQDELQNVNSNKSNSEVADTNQTTETPESKSTNESVSQTETTQQSQTNQDNKVQSDEVSKKQAESTEDAKAQSDKTENSKSTQVGSLYASEISKSSNPYDELNSELRQINNLKNKASEFSMNKTQNSGNKFYNNDTSNNVYGEIEETSYSNKKSKDGVLNFNMQDTSFYMGMIGNQNLKLKTDEISANNISGAVGETGTGTNNYTLVQSMETGESVKVSSALMDQLAESMKTNKSVRVDFGGDVSVILNVDKGGTISANFIPSTAIAEAYLKNNISTLKQTFDNQNLAYNELSYSEQQHKGQNDKQKQNQNKEKNNE